MKSKTGIIIKALLGMWFVAGILACSVMAGESGNGNSADTQPTAIDHGLRVFTCGHSFHCQVAGLLGELAKSAGISGHESVGVSVLGGARAIRHWDVPDDKNQAKKALIEGKLDVLTLSCMDHPDEGISKFAKLAFAHNPNARVTIQELWLPEDQFPFSTPPFPAGHRHPRTPEDFNRATMADLIPPSKAYCKEMEDYVAALNAEIGKPVVFVVPECQAVLALREHIMAGTAPGVTLQSELFNDGWGHPSPLLCALTGYCHFAVIYRRSPVGLPWPESVRRAGKWNSRWDNDQLNRLLQELAWDAVKQNPLSGIQPIDIKTHPSVGN